MTLDEAISRANAAYDDGFGDNLVLGYFGAPEENHGDTLARFVAAEIRDVFEDGAPAGRNADEIARALRSAAGQLTAVADAFEKETI